MKKRTKRISLSEGTVPNNQTPRRVSTQSSGKRGPFPQNSPKKTLGNFIPKETDFVFLPLGGTNEIGMNFSMVGHDGEWLLVDCGVTFFDRLGIDLLTADPTFAVKQAARIKGLLITHAHEDHIGAIEYLWPILKCPVYLTPFAAAILRQKIHNKPWASKIQIIEIGKSPVNTQEPIEKPEPKRSRHRRTETPGEDPQEWMQIGKFKVALLSMTHSIPEPSGFAIRTPLGTLVHTGDWKMDKTPVLGKKVDEARFEALGDHGVLAYLSDSTNIFSETDESSEQTVRKNLIDLVAEQKGKRVTIACFASNISRVETALLAAQKSGRKVAIIGRSVQRMIAAAQETGYLQNMPKLISDKEAMSLPPEKVMLICTGSQGEDQSALVRIASGQHPVIKMSAKDIVLFSSRVIPGNEKSIGELHNLLALQDVDIITSSEEDIHASGHPSCDSVERMYELLRPKIVIPVHGEVRHLTAQTHFAREHGIESLTPRNGVVIQLAGGSPMILGEVPSGKWAVDGKRMIVFGGNIFKERQRLSEQGAVFVTLQLAKGEIHEITLSLLGLEENDVSKNKLNNFLKEAILREFSCDLQPNTANAHSIGHKVSQWVSDKIGKKPMVEVHFSRI